MLTPFVARLAQITNSQNHQFTIPHVDRRLSQNMVCKYHPAFGQLRMVRQRLKDIERTSLVDKGLHQGLSLLRPLICFQRGYSWIL